MRGLSAERCRPAVDGGWAGFRGLKIGGAIAEGRGHLSRIVSGRGKKEGGRRRGKTLSRVRHRPRQVWQHTPLPEVSSAGWVSCGSLWLPGSPNDHKPRKRPGPLTSATPHPIDGSEKPGGLRQSKGTRKVVIKGARRRARLLPPEKSLCPRGPTGWTSITRPSASGRPVGEKSAHAGFSLSSAGESDRTWRPDPWEFKLAIACRPNPVSLMSSRKASSPDRSGNRQDL